VSNFFVTDTALADFCRVTGQNPDPATRLAVAREFEQAHRVKTLPSGAELWRGTRPRRLQFVVHVDFDRLLVSRILSAHRRARLPGRPRTITIAAGVESYDLTVTELVYEPGGDRRVAFRLQDGRWCEGERGPKIDSVLALRVVGDPPGWVDPFLG
jgi:hypothetical protein